MSTFLWTLIFHHYPSGMANANTVSTNTNRAFVVPFQQPQPQPQLQAPPANTTAAAAVFDHSYSSSYLRTATMDDMSVVSATANAATLPQNGGGTIVGGGTDNGSYSSNPLPLFSGEEFQQSFADGLRSTSVARGTSTTTELWNLQGQIGSSTDRKRRICDDYENNSDRFNDKDDDDDDKKDKKIGAVPLNSNRPAKRCKTSSPDKDFDLDVNLNVDPEIDIDIDDDDDGNDWSGVVGLVETHAPTVLLPSSPPPPAAWSYFHLSDVLSSFSIPALEASSHSGAILRSHRRHWLPLQSPACSGLVSAPNSPCKDSADLNATANRRPQFASSVGTETRRPSKSYHSMTKRKSKK